MVNNPDKCRPEFSLEAPHIPKREFLLGEDDLEEDDDGTVTEEILMEEERFLSWHQGRNIAMFSEETTRKLWVVAASPTPLEFAIKLSCLHPAVRMQARLFLWDEERKTHIYELTPESE